MVCGLAWRWPDQPVGEERLQGRGERGHDRPAGRGEVLSSRCPARAISSGAATGTSRCWPGRRGPVGGQQRQPGLPVLRRRRRRPARVRPRRSAAGRGSGAGTTADRGVSPARLDQPVEGVVDVAVEQPGPGGGDEQRRRPGRWGEPVAESQVAAQRLRRWWGAAASSRDLPNLPSRTSSRPRVRRRGRRRLGPARSPRRPASR